MEDLDEVRIQAFNNMAAQKRKVSRIYNKKIKRQTFKKVTWFGRTYYLLVAKIESSSNGPQIGKDLSRYNDSLRKMPISWQALKEGNQW